MPVSALRGAFSVAQPTPAGAVGEASMVDPQQMMDDDDAKKEDPPLIHFIKNKSYQLAGKT